MMDLIVSTVVAIALGVVVGVLGAMSRENLKLHKEIREYLEQNYKITQDLIDTLIKAERDTLRLRAELPAFARPQKSN